MPKGEGRNAKHWECFCCHYLVPVAESYCGQCGHMPGISPTPKTGSQSAGNGKGRGKAEKGRVAQQPQPQQGIAAKQLRAELEAKTKETARLQKENQRLAAEAKKAAERKAAAPAEADAATGQGTTPGPEGAAGCAVGGGSAIDQQIQQLQEVLAEAQATSERWRDKLFPRPGQYQEVLDGYKHELEQLRARKREQLPASQQLKQAQEFADRAAKRLEACRKRCEEHKEAIAARQQQLAKTEAELAVLDKENAAAAESVRKVSLRAAAAAAVTATNADAAAVSLVVPATAVEADSKLRECLAYINQHTAMSSAVLSSAVVAPAAAGQGAQSEELVLQQAQHKLLQQQLADMQRREAERMEALRLLEDQMDMDLSDSESLAPSEAGAEDCERRKKRQEHRAQRSAKRRKAFADVKSKFA